MQAEDKPTVIVAVSAEGEAEFGEQFNKSADRFVEAAKRAGAQLILIGKDAASESTTDKDRLAKAIEAEGKKTSPLWIVLLGHGTFDGREAKFNLRGPDMSEIELAKWLEPVQRPVAVINCASSSAPYINRLSGRGRIVVTATRSGHEVNYARFGEQLSQTISDPAADLDKDGQTSLLEAFLAASYKVEEFYKSEGRLATEHALLDDNGDALGTSRDFFQGVRATRPAKDGAAPDGARAHQWHLIQSAAEQSLTAEQRARRDELEVKIETLRARKASLAEADYYAQLEALLIELARVNAAR